MSDQPIAAWLIQFRSSPQLEDRYRALQAIIRLLPAEQAVAVVRNGLDDADSAIRAGSARWLSTQAGLAPRPGADDVWKSIAASFQNLVSDADPDVRFEAARGLIQVDAGNRSAAAALSALLEDGETQPAMMAAILTLFPAIRPDAGITAPPWSRFLKHEQSPVREAAARAVGTWGTHSQELARELLLLLDDEEPFVREEAARSLGAIQVAAPDVLAALETAAGDEDAIVAAAAKDSLHQLQG